MILTNFRKNFNYTDDELRLIAANRQNIVIYDNEELLKEMKKFNNGS